MPETEQKGQDLCVYVCACVCVGVFSRLVISYSLRPHGL